MLGLILYFWYMLLHVTIAEQKETGTTEREGKVRTGMIFPCKPA